MEWNKTFDDYILQWKLVGRDCMHATSAFKWVIEMGDLTGER